MSVPALRPCRTPRRRLLNLRADVPGARETVGRPAGLLGGPLHQVRLGDPPGQSGGRHSTGLRIPQLGGPAASARRSPNASRRSRPPRSASAVPAGPLGLQGPTRPPARRVLPVPVLASGGPRAACCPGAEGPRRSAGARDRSPGRNPMVEAYAVPVVRGSALGRFRIRTVTARIAAGVAALVRPVTLSGTGSRTRRRTAAGRRRGCRNRLPHMPRAAGTHRTAARRRPGSRRRTARRRPW